MLGGGRMNQTDVTKKMWRYLGRSAKQALEDKRRPAKINGAKGLSNRPGY